MAAHDTYNEATSRATAGGAATCRTGLALPSTAVLPPDASAAERAAILADISRREAMGQQVLVVSSSDEGIDALADAFAP